MSAPEAISTGACGLAHVLICEEFAGGSGAVGGGEVPAIHLPDEAPVVRPPDEDPKKSLTRSFISRKSPCNLMIGPWLLEEVLADVVEGS